MQLSCVIIEDEPLARERTGGFIERVPFLNLKGTFENALEAQTFLREVPIDLLFLDIHMDELSGIELLESFSFSGQVIFTTAYAQYALRGYDLNVTDYLLKPYDFARFLQASNKALDLYAKQKPESGPARIFVKTEHRLENIQVSEILFIEGMRDYRRIHLPGKRIMTLQTFAEFERVLAPEQVLRVHKSWMVNLSRIETVERQRIRIGDELIPISETYRERFFGMIGH